MTLPLLHSGKVRELYDLGDDLLMVASDRISTYDVVHPTPIPDKGRVLTGLSVLWFGLTRDIVPNHFEPFERRNATVRFALKSERPAVLFKGDGDQDRPNQRIAS